MARARFGRMGLASLTLAAGCTALTRMSAPSLAGSPETSGIVVIEPDITLYEKTLGTRYGVKPTGGAIARVDDPNQVVRVGPTTSLVVFSGLAPGKWRLILLEGDVYPGTNLDPEYTRWRRHYEVPSESADAFTFDVRAGDAVYAAVGVADDDRPDTRGVRLSRHDEPVAEAKIWAWMEELYEKSEWVAVFHAKVAAAGRPQAAR